MGGESAAAEQAGEKRSKKKGKRREAKEIGDGGAPEKGLAAEDGEEDHAERDTKTGKRKGREAAVKEGKKEERKEKRRKEKEAAEAGENVEVDKGEEEHGTEPEKGKGKRKREDGGEPTAADGSAGDQIVTTKDKKKKRRKECEDGEPAAADGSVGDQIMTTKDKKKKKKKKKKKRRKEHEDGEPAAADGSVGDQIVTTKDKKKKKRRKEHEDGEPAADGSAGDQTVTTKDKKKRRKECPVTLEAGSHGENSKMEKKKKKKIDGKKKGIKESDKSNPDLSNDALTGGVEAGGDGKKKNKSKEGNGGRKNEKEKAARSKGKGKRVSFANSVEVFTVDGGDEKEGGRSDGPKLVHAKRFTKEEDATIMEAIENYIEMKQLGEKGLDMIRACKKHPEIKGCWGEIAKSLPYRPSTAIYTRARILLNQSAERKWTPEDYEKVRRYVEKNGTHWKPLAEELGRSQIHVKDAWRRIKPRNLKKGHWTQEEYQNMFDLVNLDLRMKAQQEIDNGHRHIRENISWEAISEKLGTRNHKNCCLTWYTNLRSPLVKKGIWATTDDYRLLEVLENVDAVCVEDVDWENLLDNRSGEVCRQRWNEMVRSIGGHREKSFIEQVEVLSKRYCPEMLDFGKEE